MAQQLSPPSLPLVPGKLVSKISSGALVLLKELLEHSDSALRRLMGVPHPSHGGLVLPIPTCVQFIPLQSSRRLQGVAGLDCARVESLEVHPRVHIMLITVAMLCKYSSKYGHTVVSTMFTQDM